jgi:GNAT superfamily N-acetyltransferase
MPPATHTTRPFAPTDAEYAAVAALAEATPPGELCDFEPTSADDLRAFDAGFARRGAEVRRHVALRAGRVAGYAHTFPVTWALGDRSFWLTLRVEPEQRRRGIGRALLAAALADARAAGAGSLLTQFREAQAWTAEALERRGFRELLRGWEFRLDPRSLDTSPLRRYLARAQERGVTFTTLAELRERSQTWPGELCDLHRALNRDVPIPEQPNIERDWFAGFAQLLPEAFFIAVAEGRLVGESFMHPGDERHALVQKTTGVLPAYRGMGVATALKLLTVEYARSHGFTEISTWIESNNTSMLAVNERLGFRRHPGTGLIVYELPLGSPHNTPALNR